MGRGRAKAKQARIARDLKYSTPLTDLAALQHELHGDPQASDDVPASESIFGESGHESVR
jgi:hypothetical protein